MCLPSHQFDPFSHKSEFLKTRASCTLPGHPKYTCVKNNLASQTHCSWIEENPLRLMYCSGRWEGGVIRICVPSRAQITSRNPLIFLKSFIMSWVLCLLGHFIILPTKEKRALTTFLRARITLNSVTLIRSAVANNVDCVPINHKAKKFSITIRYKILLIYCNSRMVQLWKPVYQILISVGTTSLIYAFNSFSFWNRKIINL